MLRRKKKQKPLAPLKNPLEPIPDSAGDDLKSPLEGLGLGSMLLKVLVAWVIPGGLYILAALIAAPVAARVFILRSNRYHKIGLNKQALKYANRAVRVGRKGATVLAERGLVRLAMGQLDTAMEDAALALSRSPESALAHYLRAGIHDARGEHQDALKDYYRFLEPYKTPDDERGTKAQSRIAELEV